MSSHREAPQISKDPAADNTDVYAFVDENDPTKVNLIANFNPFEIPYGGPNFSEFDDDVLYTINISNSGTSEADISYQFRFTTKIVNKDTFLYNTGPLASNTDPSFNRPQTYSVTKVTRSAKGKLTSKLVGDGFVVPPCNVGDRSTPDYEANFGSKAVHELNGPKRLVFAGPRSDAFFVDLGSIFDLGGLRPLNNAHEIPLPVMQGMNGLQGLNVHTIALQLPITDLTKGNVKPTSPTAANAVIGVWSSTFRSRGQQFDSTSGTYKSFGDHVQISRLGNPLVNEVINPMAEKDKWNAQPPSGDSAFAKYAATPELAQLLPSLYPGAFPNLAAFNASKKPRLDIEAVLLTGIPASVLGGAFGTATGGPLSDMLRLNLVVPPTPDSSSKKNNLGVLYGDNAGFPNGRRVIDDVTTIEIRALAGLSIKLVYSDYEPDSILSGDAVRDGSSNTNLPLLTVFPYLAPPASGYATTPPTPAVGKTN